MPTASFRSPRAARLGGAGRAALTVAATVVCAAGVARAQSAPAGPASTGASVAAAVAEVVVRDSSGRAVAGAQVTLAPVRAEPGLVIARSGVTDDDGRVRLPGLPAGRATLGVRRIGFRAQTREVTLAAATGATLAPIAVVLGAVPQQLASVVVRATRRGPYTGHLADFNRRRDLGFGGHFYGAADIDRRNLLRTSDLLRMTPGAQVRSNGLSSTIRMRNSSCDPYVWIDGAPANAGYLDIDMFAPNTLAGVEVYTGPATVPVELRGPRGLGACGVIALWTRMPDPAPRRGKRTPVTAEMLARLVESATVYTAEQVDEPARLDTAETLTPRYPDDLRRTRTAGDALVEFVVDTTGAVERETIGLVAATHPEFGRAAREAAAEAKFLPARREGRTVRQLTQLPLRWEGK